MIFEYALGIAQYAIGYLAIFTVLLLISKMIFGSSKHGLISVLITISVIIMILNFRAVPTMETLGIFIVLVPLTLFLKSLLPYVYNESSAQRELKQHYGRMAKRTQDERKKKEALEKKKRAGNLYIKKRDN
jgi:hypothetical protein